MNWSKKSRLFLIVLLAIMLIFPMPPKCIADGYGEDSESLGQFVDDYENLNNVSVQYQIERNSTLNAMELNYSIAGTPIYENLTTYTEVDPDNALTVISSTKVIILTLFRGEGLTYLDKDYGNGYFGQDFTFTFILNVTSIEAGDADNRDFGYIVCFSNTNHNPLTDPRITILITQDGADDSQFFLSIRIDDIHAGWDDDLSSVLDVATSYYIELDRDSGDDIELEIRTDSFTGPIEDTLVVNLVNFDDDFRYISAIYKKFSATDPNDWISGTLEYLWNQSGSPGYDYDGYFTTEDYLNYTLGSSLTLLTNASLPASTSITAEFSQDNTTWVDNEGNIRGNNLLAGFYALDLRDLNYTNINIRYNFTGNGLSTPRLYQSRLITTEAEECPPALPVDDYSIIFLAIGLILMLAIAFLYTKSK